MSFSDYSGTPASNTTLGDSIFIGPNMERGKVRPALQQLAADGRELYDEMIARGFGDLPEFIAAGAGATARPVNDKLRETLSVKDFEAVGDGAADDSAPLLATAVAARIALTDGIRALAGEVKLPPGRYRITGPLDLAAVGGVSGLTISGSGGTEIVFDGPTATLKCTSSRTITFRNIVFRSTEATDVSPGDPYGIDLGQSAFTIAQSGNPLRSWRFERCHFYFFDKCFTVTGATMCSEFYFDGCIFGNCYYLMDNSNDQAVNWNFVNCDWENPELDTVKAKSSSTIFKLQKGISCKWTGGSVISYGTLVYFNLTATSSFVANSHAITFDGIRIERMDDGGTCTPLYDRVSSGYISPGNAPTVALLNAAMISRGTIPSTVTHFKVWDNVNFLVDNCDIETGKIVGVYGSLSGANTGEFTLRNSTALLYEDDATGKISDHIKHSITIEPQTRGGTLGLTFHQRSDSLSVPYSLAPNEIRFRGPTGSLPEGGTTVNVPPLPKYTVLERLVVRRFSAATYGLTVQLRDQADTTTYAEVVLAAGTDRFAEAQINLELGFQLLTTTPLMLKVIGTPESVKGLVGLGYS
jgi:hypothetical protein